MQTKNYLKLLVEHMHSAVVATLGADGHPQTRVIDMMLWDEKGVYFLTAKGKAFYEQLMEQNYISLSATKEKQSVSLRGRIRNIGKEKLDQIFIKNPYMQKIYPADTRNALDVFVIFDAEGEFFDIGDPAHVTREYFSIGSNRQETLGYYVGEGCIGYKLCYAVCPQKCIDISQKQVRIEQNHCLHCGRCMEICPKQVIEKRLSK